MGHMMDYTGDNYLTIEFDKNRNLVYIYIPNYSNIEHQVWSAKKCDVSSNPICHPMFSKICWETNVPENLQVPRPYLKYRLTDTVLPGSAGLTKTAVCLPVYHVIAEPFDFNKVIYNHTCGAAVSILITSTASPRRNQPGLWPDLSYAYLGRAAPVRRHAVGSLPPDLG